MVNAKSDYAGYLLVCSAHGGLGELDLYAKHRSASTQDLCLVLNGPFGRRTTKVLRLTRSSQSPVYFALSGPSISVEVIEQHFSSLSSNKNWRFAVVPQPAGQKACTFHRPPVSVAIYSPSKNAAASICHILGQSHG